MENLYEQIDSQSEFAVDADAAVIRRVKLLGRRSKNGRYYPASVVSEATPLYEGAPIYANHPEPGSERRERRLEDLVGHARDVREVDGELFGDLHLLKSGRHAPVILELAAGIAKDQPWRCGISHHVEAVMDPRDRARVAKIHRVHSLDLVTRPATTSSLRESEGGPVGQITVLEFAAKHKHVALTRLLAEADELPAEAMVPAEAPAASPEEQIRSAFRAMVLAVLDDTDLDAKAQTKKIGEILKQMEKLLSPEKPEPEDGAAEEEAAKEAERQRERASAEAEAKRLIEAAGLPPSSRLVAAVLSVQESERQAFVESLKPVRVPARKSATALANLPASREEALRYYR